MKFVHDIIVAGLGAIGSAALYQSARRGAEVLGIDQFEPPHDRGSSHGDTRITRLALGEGEHYVPFVRRSHEIWRKLEDDTGKSLLYQVGGLIYGSSEGRTAAHGSGDFLRTTVEVAQRHGIAHEVLDAFALASRFPQFLFQGDEWGYFEHEAGFVRPEACIAAQLEMAKVHGARIRTGERVLKWESSPGSVQVTTNHRRYEAANLILCTGAWLPDLALPVKPVAKVFRQVLYWFEPNGPPTLFTPECMPVFIRVPDARSEMFYGFPAIDGERGGLKIAAEQFSQSTVPDEMGTEVTAEEIQAMLELAQPHLAISGRCVRTAVCKYTVTPDFHFVIARHPEAANVWFASACSGHGFKHSAAVGETLAEAVIYGNTQLDIAPFRLDRFQNPHT